LRREMHQRGRASARGGIPARIRGSLNATCS
jgi:hypothetical protein